jgi:alkaline phosphatase
MKKLYTLLLVGIILTVLSLSVFKTFDSGRKAPKYIFYFIGDGFGTAQSELTQAYLKSVSDNKESLNMFSFPEHAVYSTFCDNRFITGSAAAGTSLATGYKTTVNTIGMMADKITPVKSIAEKARDKGYKVGIITTVSIDHATPAAFYAHQPSRNMYYNISLELSKSNFDYFAGGAFQKPDGNGNINEKDVAANIGLAKGSVVKNKPNSVIISKERGYHLIDNKEGFYALKKGDEKTLIFAPRVNGGNSLYYALDQTREDLGLDEFTAKGIELLDNPDGFFMMIEGGKIDWSCHANDAATTIHDVIQFDDAVGEALKFYNQHPDETLIIVCGDHETGGLSLGFTGTGYASNYALLKNQTISYEEYTKIVDTYRAKANVSFSKAMISVEKYFGLGNKDKGLELTAFENKQLQAAYRMSMIEPKKRPHTDEYFVTYAYYDPFTTTVTKILAQKAGVAWGTFNHTASPIPVRALGNGSEIFKGYLDNTDIPKKIESLLR